MSLRFCIASVLFLATALQGHSADTIGDRLKAGENLKIVTYGTSLTAGGGWVPQMKAALDAKFPGQIVLENTAKGGMTSEWGVENFDERVVAKKPDVLFLEFAVNDAVERFGIPEAKSRRNLESMIDRARRANPDIEIILQTTNPVLDRPKGHDGHRPDLEKRFETVRKVASAKNTRLIDNEPAWRRLLETDEAAFRKLVPDGLHPTPEGYSEVVTPALLAALGISDVPASEPAKDTASANGVIRSDILVYGGTSAAVTAAVQAKRMGKNVVLLSPEKHLGGLTSGGLGWTDLGDPRTIGGLSREFYHRVYKHYQQPDAWKWQPRESFGGQAQGTKAMDDVNETMWIFEPHVAEKIFDDLIEEHGVRVEHGRLNLDAGVARKGNRIQAIRTEDGRVFAADMFIDATYEGDLMAKAGVSYAIGREPNAKYGEKFNGIQEREAKKNQLPPGISPYVVPGDPKSGLLPGVNANAGGADGAGDGKIQAYCYRMVLTSHPENRIPIRKPEGYDEKDFEILFRAIEAGQKDRFFKVDAVPNRKTDSNNASGISCDYIGMNYEYPEGDYKTRERIADAHRYWQLGILWTLQNHPRVPESIRNAHAKWGLPADEFVDNGHWPHQLYVREARRMVSDFVMTERTIHDKKGVSRPIGMGSYNMDSHHVQRIVGRNGDLINEGDVQESARGPYQIDYGAIVPKQSECENLLVPVCLSASHIAYGSIRMEPVFMILGQSAAAAAAIAQDDKVPVQRVDYRKLKEQLQKDGQTLSLDS